MSVATNLSDYNRNHRLVVYRSFVGERNRRRLLEIKASECTGQRWSVTEHSRLHAIGIGAAQTSPQRHRPLSAMDLSRFQNILPATRCKKT